LIIAGVVGKSRPDTIVSAASGGTPAGPEHTQGTYTAAGTRSVSPRLFVTWMYTMPK